MGCLTMGIAFWFTFITGDIKGFQVEGPFDTLAECRVYQDEKEAEYLTTSSCYAKVEDCR